MPELMSEHFCPNVAKFFIWPVFLMILPSLNLRAGLHNSEDVLLLSGLCVLPISTSRQVPVSRCSRPMKRSAHHLLLISTCSVGRASAIKSLCPPPTSTSY